MRTNTIASGRRALMGAVFALVAIMLTACGSGSATTADIAKPGGLINPQTYVRQFKEPGAAHALIDVRTPEEYASGRIAGAVNISLQELPARLSEVPKDRPVVLYCRSGNRSAQAMDVLKASGYTNIYDMGGIIAWQSAGLPVE
jgi:rhodanese-related sulfurtransferase